MTKRNFFFFNLKDSRMRRAVSCYNAWNIGKFLPSNFVSSGQLTSRIPVNSSLLIISSVSKEIFAITIFCLNFPLDERETMSELLFLFRYYLETRINISPLWHPLILLIYHLSLHASLTSHSTL